MPARLVINPVMSETVEETVRTDPVTGQVLETRMVTRRWPKVSIMEDPGRAPKTGIDESGQPFSVQPTYGHSSAISDGQAGQRNGDCLSLVTGVDFSPLDADPEIVSLFEMPDRTGATMRTYLEKRPSEAGFSRAKVTRLRQRLETLGRASFDIPDDAPLHEWANRMAQAFGNFNMRQHMAKVPGA